MKARLDSGGQPSTQELAVGGWAATTLNPTIAKASTQSNAQLDSGGQPSTQQPASGGGSENETPATLSNLAENISLFSSVARIFLDERSVPRKQNSPANQVELPEVESKQPSERKDAEDPQAKMLIKENEDVKASGKVPLQVKFRKEEQTEAALQELKKEVYNLQQDNALLKKERVLLLNDVLRMGGQNENLKEENKRLTADINTLRQNINRISTQERLHGEDFYIQHFKDLKNEIESWAARHSKLNRAVNLDRRTQTSVLAIW
jgi:hypothetical protein